MENLNTGSVVDFHQLKDYEKAARDFSEGNKELEKLLLNCFHRGIQTTACCGGHENENRKPYISFSYSPENEQVIYALLSNLKDRECVFRYNKLANRKSFFSVEEGQVFDFHHESTLFSDMNDVICSFDMGKDYYTELPKDLQKYSSILKNSENDEFLNANGTSDYFQMCYEKGLNGYEYTMLTSNPYYNMMAEKGNFTKDETEGFPSYILNVSNREMAISALNGLATNIQTFGNKQEETFNHSQSQTSQPQEKENRFESDARIGKGAL